MATTIETSPVSPETPTRAAQSRVVGSIAPWYKDAVIYQVHVRTFADSNGDGIGDFRGLTGKLDYLQDLGVTAIWVQPFYPSPLRDDGYDVADYTNVHPNYGTLKDFRAFLNEAHARGLKVITELVINHTSDQHPWFQRARTAKEGSTARNFYVWSDTPEKYREARILFKDFEQSNWTWDSVAKQYFWHRFYSHQPDLNYDNPAVMRAVIQALDFWLKMGVDGLRLDAIPYLYEREGTNCENLPETHAALKHLRAHMDAHYKDRMFLAEANQWPEDAVAYFGDGDECNMAFHFPVMPRMFMAVRMEDRFPIMDILAQTPAIPDNAQWAMFLRNHDELTLEMVTDEERDYMYRVYASDQEARINLGIRRRLAPLLNNNRRRIELMNGLLFSLPGTPVLYYGDEIGMGDNIYLGDRNGVRTPMQWNANRNAGFSDANPQRLYLPITSLPEYSYESVNVEAQQANPQSLLWWMKRLIALRKRYPAFGAGSIEFLTPDNRKVLAFLRRHEGQTLLVVANMSRFVQGAELDLSQFPGYTPVEAFGHTEFPAVTTDRPYFLTLGPHSFYWFEMQAPRGPVEQIGPDGVPEHQWPTLTVSRNWEDLFGTKMRGNLARILRTYMPERRWFGAKARRMTNTEIVDAVSLPTESGNAILAFVRVSFAEGDPDLYILPLMHATGERAEVLRLTAPHAVVATVATGEHDGVLYDAVVERAFALALLDGIAGRRRYKSAGGELSGVPTSLYRQLRGPADANIEPQVGSVEQSNTSIIFGDRFILKLFRRLGEGVNPDLEIGRFLTEVAHAEGTPPLGGSVEYRSAGGEPVSLAMLQALVPNEGDAWQYTVDMLDDYYERAITYTEANPADLMPSAAQLRGMEAPQFPDLAREYIGTYLESARILGQRTAEMHRALAMPTRDAAFKPEPFTPMYQRGMYQSLRTQANTALALLRKRVSTLSETGRAEAEVVLAGEAEITARFSAIRDMPIHATRQRTHGDYHLGQVLYTGKDFVIIDFEGEPMRSLSERRIKRSALRDVAGMLRSFHYAAFSPLVNPEIGGTVRPEDSVALEPWARFWYAWVTATFLSAYREAAADAAFIPKDEREFETLLDARLLEKALYELSYELNNRPTWAGIPLRGIRDLLHGTGIREVTA